MLSKTFSLFSIYAMLAKFGRLKKNIKFFYKKSTFSGIEKCPKFPGIPFQTSIYNEFLNKPNLNLLEYNFFKGWELI